MYDPVSSFSLCVIFIILAFVFVNPIKKNYANNLCKVVTLSD